MAQPQTQFAYLERIGLVASTKAGSVDALLTQISHASVIKEQVQEIALFTNGQNHHTVVGIRCDSDRAAAKAILEPQGYEESRTFDPNEVFNTAAV